MIALVTAGCAETQDPNQTALNPAGLNTGGDAAADGNLAPVSDSSQRVSQPHAPPAQGVYQDYPDDNPNQPDYRGQLVYASQPPPPLPEYSQPPCPGDNYIWTPGYWSYADAGFYWVPGA